MSSIYHVADEVAISTATSKYRYMRKLEYDIRQQMFACKNNITELNADLMILSKQELNNSERDFLEDIINKKIQKNLQVLQSLKKSIVLVSTCCKDLKRELKQYNSIHSNIGGKRWFSF